MNGKGAQSLVWCHRNAWMSFTIFCLYRDTSDLRPQFIEILYIYKKKTKLNEISEIS